MLPVFCRCLAVAVLLVLEVFYLTIRFDTRGLDFEPRWWGSWMGEVHWVPRFAIAMGGALLLFAGKAIWEALPRLASELQPLRRAGPALLAHLVTYAAFTSVTVLVFERDTRQVANASLWVAAWWALGFLSVALLALSAFHLRVWARCLWQGRWPLAAAATVAVAASVFGWATDFLWRPLGQGTVWAVVALLRMLGIETVSDTTFLIVGTPSFAVAIAPSCSGYEGIGLFWTFIGVYLWLFRKCLCFPQALLLIPVGTILMWCCNALRIAGLITVGSWGSEAVALGGFHSQVGWLAFNAVALGLVAGSQRLRFFTSESVCHAAACAMLSRPLRSSAPAQIDERPRKHATPGVKAYPPANAAAPYLAPFLAVLATGMMTTAFSAEFDYCYPVRLLVGGAVLYHYRRFYSGLGWPCSCPGAAIGAGVFVLWMAVDRLQVQPGIGSAFPEALAGMGQWWAMSWLLVRMAGYVVLTPVVEELAFRGYLNSRLSGNHCQEIGQFTWLSFLLSSLLFGLSHQGHWLAGSMAGMGYALALYRRRNLMDAVLAHATTNALIAGYVLLTERWSLWG
jgi:exosortase E/protease (VPEID-CTERM system)